MTLGEKIKSYRERAKLSQLDLELELGSGAGSISRIENNKINPRRETILKIGYALDLDKRQISDLLDVMHLFPAEAEIEEAIAEVKGYLGNPNKLAYLIDEWANMHMVSPMFMQLIGLDFNKDQAVFRGRHMFEIVLLPEYGISKFFDVEGSIDVLSRELARINYEVKLEGTPLFQTLVKIPAFNLLWQESLKVTNEDLLNPENKKVVFNLGGEKHEYYFTREKLKSHPRFEVIEYLPKN